MNTKLREDADEIIEYAIRSVLPDKAVKRALEKADFPGRIVLVSVGKAAWQMAKAAYEILSERIDRGIVITKYGHVKGEIGSIPCYEAGHPLPDENSVKSTAEAIRTVSGLRAEDTVLLLLSGGGSALFEKPLVPLDELRDITSQLLACGAAITEINTIRKRLSAVKGGRFGRLCAPASVYCVVLSDIVGDPLDMIASGPAFPDSSTCADAEAIIRKYGIKLSAEAEKIIRTETPKTVENVTTCITGNVTHLCRATADICKTLGYEPIILTDTLGCEASQAGRFLSSIAVTHQRDGAKRAYIAGGETVVHLKGSGLGGRNQELALSAAAEIRGIKNAAVFSVGSDGTDGPTDAAGGYVDGDTMDALAEKGLDHAAVLENNDSYHALRSIGGLIVTGPTGTNVNDVSVVLIDNP